MKLVDFLEERHSWANYTLFAESIPHLLHWDWAYLWMLGRQSAIPVEWANRLEAWRRMVAMLLLGDLEIQSVAIPQPFLTYTRAFNIKETGFVSAQGICGGRPIGVLSPTVIVRPLPEPNRFDITGEILAKELPNHLDPPPGRDRRVELLQMLQHARKILLASESVFARDSLVPLLDAKLRVEASEGSRRFPMSPLPVVSILRAADVSAWDRLSCVSITLMKPQVGAVARRLHFVPKCQY